MKAVILAGGLGTRLKPFTQVIPKPLLPIGESSVLEIQVLSLKRCGVSEIIIATNHMSEVVEAYLRDGSQYGVPISFSKETKALGTCGPVKLLERRLTEPFLLMNGDILTTLDFAKPFEFALARDADLTVITKELRTPFHFGKVSAKGDYLVDIEEKQDLRFEVLAGIYVLKPGVFRFIPPDTYFGMDLLIKAMLVANAPVTRYPMQEYWLDIGRIDDYQTAQDAYADHFRGLKGSA